MEEKEEIETPIVKESKFWPRVLLIVGVSLLVLLLGLVIIKFAPGIIKLFGILGSAASVWVGWSEIQRINNERKNRNEQ